MDVPATSSGDLAVSAATVVTARPARLLSVVITPAAAASTIIVYDNASAASGTVLLRLVAQASTFSTIWTLDVGLVANNGLTVAITGAAAVGTVMYSAM